MATNSPKRQVPKAKRSVIRWLLDSDPSIRWQVMRDLIGAPADEVAAERARVAIEGAGATRCAPYGCWTGIQHETNATAAGRDGDYEN
jgi:hypothetical protein